MLVLRTADHLRHLAALKNTFPAMAAAAGRAIELILRDPVMPDYSKPAVDTEDPYSSGSNLHSG